MGDYPNWFASDAIHYFQRHLSHFAGQENLSFLQIGAYTGDASVWLLSEILTAKGSRLVDVDTWQGSEEGLAVEYDWDDIFNLYKSKVSFSNKIETKQMTSAEYLAKCQESLAGECQESFDFIYIDGDHTSKVVAADAEGAWELLKADGILAFDDYQWGEWLSDKELTPAPAIDRFLNSKINQYELLEKARQVWIRKSDRKGEK